MSWYIIINPKAGNSKIKPRIKELKSLLKTYNLKYELAYTDYKFHAKSICVDAINSGYRKIMAIGGDGTNHEVINGIMSQDVVDSTEVIFFGLPNGTGNDWGKHHGLPKSWEERFQLLNNPTYKYQDIGIADYYNNETKESRFFNSIAGMAYDAYVVKSLEEKGRKSNSIAYLISVFKLLFKYKKNNVEIKFNDKTIHTPVYTVNLGICKYTGGGMSLTPHAISNDGLLALTIAKNLSKWKVIKNTYRFYNESILSLPEIEGHQVKTLEIQSTNDDKLHIELDGEYVGIGPIKFSIIQNALKFIG